MISYEAMVTEVTLRLGGRTDIASRIDRWINYAMLELAMSPRFNFYELDAGYAGTVAAGTTSLGLHDAIPVGPDFWFILHVTDYTNRTRIRRISWLEYETLPQATTVPGFVTFYARYGRNMYLYPVPESDFTIRIHYRKRPTLLGPGTTYDYLGDEWEEPLIQLATVKGWEALDQRDKASEQRVLLERLLAIREDVPQLEDGYDSEVTISPELDSL